MLSRRSVRIKVMQLLFSLNRDKELSYRETENRYFDSVEKSFELLLLNLYLICQITQESQSDKEKRSKKHLPTEADKVFTAKFYENEIIQSLVKNLSLQTKFKKLDFERVRNEDYFKKIYSNFSKSEAYLKYITEEDTKASHLEILLELFRFCRKDEFFLELVEDAFPNWIDDKSVVIGTVKKIFKRAPDLPDKFFMEYHPDDETVKDFGQSLLDQTYKQDKDLLAIVKPNLENWDHDRVAIIDMILLKMAICELIGFESIPTKVTINEYVELSKNYSTAKSKEFINGVLDSVLTQLNEEKKIKKSGRGLIE